MQLENTCRTNGAARVTRSRKLSGGANAKPRGPRGRCQSACAIGTPSGSSAHGGRASRTPRHGFVARRHIQVSHGSRNGGSANGVAITANKHQGIRAAICWNEELAELARSHNNANVLCIPARFISTELAKQICTKFITTEFEGGRHANRVNKIAC